MSGGVFNLEVLDQRPAISILEIAGRNAKQAFAQESGGHRWQRIPPTEKRGRVQTSTITVAILDPIKIEEIEIEGDIEWEAFRGSGKGGQKRNKTASAIRLTHKPTGITIRYESERSQHMNLRAAKAILASRIQQQFRSSVLQDRHTDRKNQVGSGMRGDKRRTIRVRDNQVNDHLTGKKISYKQYARGEVEALH